MSILSRLIAWMYHLPSAETYAIAVDRNLDAPMPDGVVLRADHYYPRMDRNCPTLLIRTPYGRARLGMLWGYVFAERGFQVLIQSCRGTDDSGGDFTPFRGEREDGLATLAWLKSQDWFNGTLAMSGPSYMGFTQWALAPDAGSVLKAMSTHVTSSEFRSVMYPGGSFNLEIFLQWMQITHSLRGSLLQYLRDTFTAGRRIKAALAHLPLCEADEIVTGQRKAFWHDWLQHTEPGDPWWAVEDHSQRVADVTAPNHLISGWYDFLLPQLLRDYTTLQQAGRNPYLTIGPWSHSSNGLVEMGMRESLIWLRAHLLGEINTLRSDPVCIYVMGANEWRTMAVWPPPALQRQRWHLQGDGTLSMDTPAQSPARHFRYDPADPTPNVGGATNATLGQGTGAQDNRTLEARADVLTFTSLPLEHAIEVIGSVVAEIWMQSSCEHTDLFVRLCDVYPDGKSMNVCDGLVRLVPNRPVPDAYGYRKAVLELWPTAYCFKRGHCMRVQVSSGAFPRFARNLGTGEALASATAMRVAEQQIYHDPPHPSALILPIAQA